MPVVHNFNECLARSHSYAEAPWWHEVYENAFPTMQAALNVRQNGWAQRAGIDRQIVLDCGRIIKVDEKVRERDYDDFFLEYYSVVQDKTRGWVAKDLDCDYIAYAFVPSQTCYLLPFLELRRAWRNNRCTWVDRYPVRDIPNERYDTRGVCVPINVVLDAISDAMKVTWNNNPAAGRGVAAGAGDGARTTRSNEGKAW